MTSTGDKPLVLVVDDEESVADVYALQLLEEFETRVAYGGREALEQFDSTVDAVLLDRRMPDIHGDEVLEAIRDRGDECVVIMLTAVDPDLNILEMDFDDYLSKPVEGETLRETLKHHLETARDEMVTDDLTEFLSLVAKLDVLESELSYSEQQSSREFQRVKERLRTLQSELEGEVDNLEELVEVHRSIARSP